MPTFADIAIGEFFTRPGIRNIMCKTSQHVAIVCRPEASRTMPVPLGDEVIPASRALYMLHQALITQQEAKAALARLEAHLAPMTERQTRALHSWIADPEETPSQEDLQEFLDKYQG